MRRIALLLIAATAAAVLASLVPAGSQGGGAAQAAEATQPNIIVILTDDQRVNTLQTMPTVRKELRARGADYLGIVPTSTCCPSRASILTGNLSHTTNVYTNTLDFGGWPAFDASGYEDETIAVALKDAGYWTGYVGKYLNYWNHAPDGFVPAGWDRFSALYDSHGQGAGRYYDYELRGTNAPRTFGSSPSDYSTNVIKRRALRFIQNSPDDQPYLAFVTPYAPHAQYKALRRDKGTYQPKKPYNNPGVNEHDMSDKPSFMQDMEPVAPHRISKAQIGTGEALAAVDRLVNSLISAADMSNTLVIFASDNGVFWGDHRFEQKYRPHRWSTEVPMIMRWDGVIAPGTTGMVANIDIAPTILEAAGVPNALSTEGDSVFDGTRGRVLVEGVELESRPAYCGVRTPQHLFVQYANGEHELYDYEVDRFELDNKADAPEYDDIKNDLRQQAQQLCNPEPPGFSWNP